MKKTFLLTLLALLIILTGCKSGETPATPIVTEYDAGNVPIITESITEDGKILRDVTVAERPLSEINTTEDD